MSTNSAPLAALSHVCGVELRYFELVHIRFSGSGGKPKLRRCYLGVGKHALYLIRRDLTGIVGEEGHIYYAHVEEVVEDSNTYTDFCIMLNENRFPEWESNRVFVVSMKRTELLHHIAVTWVSDYMWRFAKVIAFPISVAPVTDLKVFFEGTRHLKSIDARDGAVSSPFTQLPVIPYAGMQKIDIKGYYFFLPSDFVSQPTKGVYSCRKTGCELSVHVHNAESMLDLEHFNKNRHVRWVALDYKAHMQESRSRMEDTSGRGQTYTVYANQSFYKRMNLSDDPSQWTGWEVQLENKQLQEFWSCVFLRRNYLPPLLDTCQDIGIIFKWRGSFGGGFGLNKTMEEPEIRTIVSSWAHCAANSMAPAITETTNSMFFVNACELLKIQPALYKHAEEDGDAAELEAAHDVIRKMKERNPEELKRQQKIVENLKNSSVGLPCDITNFIYRDVVQARLNALLYTEEAYHWLDTRFKLKPSVLPNYSNKNVAGSEGGKSTQLLLNNIWIDAKRFMKSILKILHDENVLGNPELLRDLGSGSDLEPAVQDPFQVPTKLFYAVQFRTPDSPSIETDARRNSWFWRVSKYLAYCVNGGILGANKFNLCHIISACFFGPGGSSALAIEAKKRINRVILFLLHLRPNNFQVKFNESTPLLVVLKNLDSNIGQSKTLAEGGSPEKAGGEGEGCSTKVNVDHLPSGWIFNQTIMQQLIETLFIYREVCLSNEADYAKVLDNLLFSRNVHVALKSAILRQVIEACQDENVGEQKTNDGPSNRLHMTRAFIRNIIGSLVSLMRNQDSVFLQALGTAAIVNMTQSMAFVKNMLVGEDEADAPTAIEKQSEETEFQTSSSAGSQSISVLTILQRNLFARRDEDLVEYTLQLLVNLTKTAHIREMVFAHPGMLSELMGVLLSSYSTPHECSRLLTPMCSIIGQLSNDEEIRAYLFSSYGVSIVDCCLYINDSISGVFCFSYLSAEPANQTKDIVPLKSKIYFILKQLCVNNAKMKNLVCPRVIASASKELFLIMDTFQGVCELMDEDEENENGPGNLTPQHGDREALPPPAMQAALKVSSLGGYGGEIKTNQRADHLKFWMQHKYFTMLLDCFSNLLSLMTMLAIDRRAHQLMREAGIMDFFSLDLSERYEVIFDKVRAFRKVIMAASFDDDLVAPPAAESPSFQKK